MRAGWAFVLVCALLPMLVSAQSWWEKREAELPLPMARCRKIDRDLVLSGKLDDPLWQQAASVELNRATNGQPGKFKTTARFLYNDRYLYVGFQCQDDYVWSTLTARDAEIWREEVVELFIAPTGAARNYYELELNPLNTAFDQFVLNGKQPNGMYRDDVVMLLDYIIAGMITKTAVDGELNKPGGAKGWTGEMAIPFSGLIGPDAVVPSRGAQWRVNLYRMDMPTPYTYDFSSWSPTVFVDAHRPWRFSVLTFVDDTPAPPPTPATEVPTWTATKVTRDVVLSGKLDDPLWQQVTPVILVNAENGAPGRVATTARLLYNSRYLYVGFTCEDPHIVSTNTRRDAPLYEQDVVEVFLSPTGSSRQYFETEVSPNNTQADTFVLNGRPLGGPQWNNFNTFFDFNINGLETRTSRDGGRWQVEIAIPLRSLFGQDALPTPGTRWRANLLRGDLREDKTIDYYAASPPLLPNDLHRVGRMGTIVFGE